MTESAAPFDRVHLFDVASSPSPHVSALTHRVYIWRVRSPSGCLRFPLRVPEPADDAPADDDDARRGMGPRSWQSPVGGALRLPSLRLPLPPLPPPPPLLLPLLSWQDSPQS